MDRAQLVARLLSELATARAAISASYLGLWRPAERSLADAARVDAMRGTERDLEAGEVREEERPPRYGAQ